MMSSPQPWPLYMGGKGQLKRQNPKTSDAALEECTTAPEWTEKVRMPSPVPELYYYPVWRVTSRHLGRNGFQTTLKLEFHYLEPLESFFLSNYFHSECIRDRVCFITSLIPVVTNLQVTIIHHTRGMTVVHIGGVMNHWGGGSFDTAPQSPLGRQPWW